MSYYYNPGCSHQSCTAYPSHAEAAAAYNGCMVCYPAYFPYDRLGLCFGNSHEIPVQSRKRKRETECRDARDFSIRALLGLRDDDTSEDNISCSSDNFSTQYVNEEHSGHSVANYSTDEMSPNLWSHSLANLAKVAGAADFFTQPKPTSLRYRSSAAEDFYSRYCEPVSPVSVAETFVSSTDDAYAPGELDNSSLPTPSAHSQSPAYSCSRSSEDSSPSAKKLRRGRTMFKPQQLEKLEEEFAKTQYMVGAARLELAAELKLTESQVKVWFQNRRIKERKQNMDAQKATLSKLKEDACSSRSS